MAVNSLLSDNGSMQEPFLTIRTCIRDVLRALVQDSYKKHVVIEKARQRLLKYRMHDFPIKNFILLILLGEHFIDFIIIIFSFYYFFLIGNLECKHSSPNMNDKKLCGNKLRFQCFKKRSY